MFFESNNVRPHIIVGTQELDIKLYGQNQQSVSQNDQLSGRLSHFRL